MAYPRDGRIILQARSDGTIEAASGTEIIGYDTIGGTTSTALQGNIVVTAKSTVVNTGQITKITIYMANTTSTRDIKVAAYLDNGSNYPGALIGSEKEFLDIGTFTEEWHDFDVTSANINVTAGQSVWLAATISGAGSTIYYNAIANSRYLLAWGVYADPFPNPFTGGQTVGTAKYSFKATVTY